MSIAKPYYRIWRPFPNDDLFQNDYALDPRNAADAIDLIRGYHLLVCADEENIGAPGAIPTRDLSLRRRALYAAELRAQ